MRSTSGIVMWATAALLTVAIAACGSGDADDVPVVRAIKTADPALAFAPLVYLHEAETRFPTGARRFIDRSGLAWSNGRCPDDTLAVGRVAERTRSGVAPAMAIERLGSKPGYRHRPLNADCESRRRVVHSTLDHTRPHDRNRRRPGLGADQGFYLDLLTAAYGGDRRLEQRGGESVLRAVPAYFELRPVTVARRPNLRLRYWLLFAHAESYGRNGVRVSSREGDWERIDVLIRRGPGRGRYTPVVVTSYVDGAAREHLWPDVERVAGATSGDRTHPVVFAARGSHAPYLRPGRHPRRVRGDDGRPVTAFDEASPACSDCPRWRTWDHLRPAWREPWYGFGGGWGQERGGSDTTGPLGPSPFVR